MTLTPDQYVRAFSGFHRDMEQQVRDVVRRVYRQAGLGRRGVDLEVAKDLVSDALAGMVLEYGSVAEAFGMYLFEEMTGEKAVPSDLTTLDLESAARASTYGIMAKYALPQEMLPGAMTRHVLGQARGAIHSSAARVPEMAYARVPSYRGQRHGAGPCPFCIVLASRGPVYADTVTAGAAGLGNEYHDDCYCVPTLMRKGNPEMGDFGDPSDWPSGYTPDKLYKEIYEPSHDYLDTIEDVTRKIAAKHPSFPLS